MRKLVFAVIAAVLAASVQATTYYVDAARPDDSGDGLTPETAKRHIQAAVDLCASGSTVYVAEGVYNDYVAECSFDSVRARVVITNKIHLVASGAKKNTVIEGAYDDESEDGVGPSAVRGVYIYYGSTKAQQKSAGSIVEGFTIRRCATTSGGFGAAISMSSSYALNCDIESCGASRGGAFSGGLAIRCRVEDCWTVAGDKPYGSVAHNASLMNSLIVRQRSSTSRLFSYPSTILNCTFAGNLGGGNFGYATSAHRVFNSIYVDNSQSKFESSYSILSNCIVQAGLTGCSLARCGNLSTNESAYAFAAPALDDWRPSTELGAVGAGDAELLKIVSLPTELEDQRYVDYAGNPIPRTGAITCGALQDVSTTTNGLLKFVGNKGWEIDGFGTLKETKPDLNYIWTDDYPGMLKMRKAGAALTNLVWYTLSTNNGAKVVNHYPNLDGWTGVVPRAGMTNEVAALTPSKVLYVDAAVETDEGADGSAENPYATIQAAVLQAPSGNKSSAYKHSVVLVRKGEYRTGGQNSARVEAPNKIGGSFVYKNIRIVAEDGPDQTSIVGEKGVKCFAANLPTLLQGFTLTGGDITGDGAACWANSYSNGTVADCLIAGNSGNSIAYCSTVHRCRFERNVVTSVATTSAVVLGKNDSSMAPLVNCEIVHPAAANGNTYAIGRYVRVVFSSIDGRITSGYNPYLYSLLRGGQTISSPGGAHSCFAHGDPLTAGGSSVVEGCKNGRSRCVNFGRGDFRLRDDSPCLGMVAFDMMYCADATLDMAGDPLKLETLAGNTAGARQKWSVHYEPQGLLMLVR